MSDHRNQHHQGERRNRKKNHGVENDLDQGKDGAEMIDQALDLGRGQDHAIGKDVAAIGDSYVPHVK